MRDINSYFKSNSKTFFISGIDTNIGKTYATGFLAKELNQNGINCITQKIIQTGCYGISEDILKHRELMDSPILDIDRDLTTCPIVLSYPASPHLSAKIDNIVLDFSVVEEATKRLEERYDRVLLEGAGGLMVPLKLNYLTIDYVKEHNLPLILVTSGRLGSINHTLLSIAICKQYGIEIEFLVYNHYPKCDEIISKDTLSFLRGTGYEVVEL